MPRPFWVFAGHRGHFVGFVMLWLIWSLTTVSMSPLWGGILFPRCPSVCLSIRSCRPWHFGFSLISWKGSNWSSSNFLNILISARCTYIIETQGLVANSDRVTALCNSEWYWIVHVLGNQLLPELLLKPSDTLRTQCRHIEHLHEEVWCHKITFWQNDSILNLAIFFNTLLLNESFVNAQIVHAWGTQLEPELLLKPSDTLHTQYRHIEHLHEEVWCQVFWT